MKKRILTMLLAMVMTIGLIACGGNSSETAEETETTTEETEKEKITIAIGNTYAPFCYLDESEKPAGYEAELFALVAEKMSDKYEVEVVCDSWDNLFVGVESGKYDIVSHHLAYNANRAEKYTISEESLMYYGNYRIVYKAGRTDITDLESLAGLTLSNDGKDNVGTFILPFNEEHPDNPIILQETEASDEAVVAGIQNGLYDGYIHTYFDVKTRFIDKYPDAGLELGSVDLVEDGLDCGTYAILQKGNTELKEDLDAAIKALRDEGKISELSVNWFGTDYSVQPE